MPTSHDSDSEEWVESSSDSDTSSHHDATGCVRASRAPVLSALLDEALLTISPVFRASPNCAEGVEEEDSWSHGDVPGSVGLKSRPAQTRISFRNGEVGDEGLGKGRKLGRGMHDACKAACGRDEGMREWGERGQDVGDGQACEMRVMVLLRSMRFMVPLRAMRVMGLLRA